MVGNVRNIQNAQRNTKIIYILVQKIKTVKMLIWDFTKTFCEEKV